MSVTVQTSGIIDQPVARVFQFYAREHVQNHPRWDPDIQLEQISEGPIGVGTVIKRINSRSGKPVEGTMEVIGFEPDQAVTMLIQDGPVKLIARATYEAEDNDQTRITFNLEFPDLDEVNSDMLVKGIQRSIQNINQLLASGGNE